MHLGIIKITYNRTATHFMDDRFVNLGDEVILTLLWQSGASESATVSMFCYKFKYLPLTVQMRGFARRVYVCERERERERETGHKRSLKFWMHLKSSPTESLHFKALQTQELNPEKSPLSQLVLRLTNLTNSTNTNQSQTSTASHLNIKINQIIKQYKNTYLEHWDQETKTQSKLQLYWTIKSNYELKDYLQSVRDTKQRRILTKYRLSEAQTSHRDRQTQKELVTQRAKSVCSLWDKRDRDRDALSPSLS